jgi:hypothetical protein
MSIYGFTRGGDRPQCSRVRWRHRAVIAVTSLLAAVAPIVSFAPPAAASTQSPVLMTLRLGAAPQSVTVPVRFPAAMCSAVPGHPELRGHTCMGSLTETVSTTTLASVRTATSASAASTILVTQTNAVCGPACYWRSSVTESTTYYTSTQRFYTNWTDCSNWYASYGYTMSITWCSATGSNTSTQTSGDNLTICVPLQCDGDYFRQWINARFQVGVYCGGAGPFGVFC